MSLGVCFSVNASSLTSVHPRHLWGKLILMNNALVIYAAILPLNQCFIVSFPYYLYINHNQRFQSKYYLLYKSIWLPKYNKQKPLCIYLMLK